MFAPWVIATRVAARTPWTRRPRRAPSPAPGDEGARVLDVVEEAHAGEALDYRRHHGLGVALLAQAPAQVRPGAPGALEQCQGRLATGVRVGRALGTTAREGAAR